MSVSSRSLDLAPPPSSAYLGVLLAIALVTGGCSNLRGTADVKTVTDDLESRTGHAFAGRGAGDFSPLAGGAVLTESDAVDLAVVNNAAFAEQLADLGVSRADIVQAGLIANPDAALLIPMGPKQLEATITAPLESLWLRDSRLKAAGHANSRNAARLVQLGLDLVRDVRLAYADVALARRRLELAELAATDREKVAAIADARVRAGDAGPLDSATANVELLVARRDVQDQRSAQEIAEERLRALLGAGAVRTKFDVESLPWEDRGADPDVAALLPGALAGRPDLRAADIAIDAARLRLSLSKIEWFNLAFIADANERGTSGFEAGPGFRFTLPIFNQNQGGIARAEAELQRSLCARRTIADRVILEVRESAIRYRQSREDLTAWRTRVRPALEKAYDLASRAYERGATPQVQVLDTNRQLLDARAREAQAAANVVKAWAELERSVGRRLDVAEPTTRPTTRLSSAIQTSVPATRACSLSLGGPQRVRPGHDSITVIPGVGVALRTKPLAILGDPR